MNKQLKQLSVLTICLFAVSFLLYLNENKINSDLTAGSDFVKGFDPSKANKIMIKHADGKALTLRKNNTNFVLAEHHNYPAENEKINNLLFNIAGIQIKEKVTSSKGKQEDFELTEEKAKTEIIVFNSQEKEILNILVGKEKNSEANYIRFKNKNDIYLTTGKISFPTDTSSYINKTINIFKTDEVQNISAKFKDQSIEITKEGEDFQLAKANKKNSKKIKKEDLKNYVGKLNNISFQNFKPMNSTESVVLNFDQNLSLVDKNQITTNIKFASSNKKYFVHLSSSTRNAPKEITLSQNETDEKMQSIDKMIKAQQRSQNFNLKHSGWVYEVSENTFNNFTVIK
ncbi:MAG: DUF4340 domain-containing protein [Bdellovibrionaceae bacterium]|jgi:hypothetical protein|nr:DUF4340 domain-containing protein [Pseudobdellovibrionaceae bacterium]